MPADFGAPIGARQMVSCFFSVVGTTQLSFFYSLAMPDVKVLDQDLLNCFVSLRLHVDA